MLAGHGLVDEEKEMLLFSALKIVNRRTKLLPSRYIRHLNIETNKKIGKYINNEKLLGDVYHELQSMGYIYMEEGDKYYRLTGRGKDAIRRGWVHRNCKWYNTGKAAKYAVVISIIALLVAIIGNNNIWSVVKFLGEQLMQLWQT